MHIINHFRTITRHRHKVMQHCFKAGIPMQGLMHDLSKYSLVEFVPGAKYWQGNRSPNEKERELFGYSLAWMHHKGRNKHHFEYWNDLSMVSHQYEPVPMPIRYVAEMFCDRVAASKIYRAEKYDDGYPLYYFMRGKTGRKMHPETSDLLEKWLRLLAEQGEDAAFSQIRQEIRAAKKQ